MKKLILSLLVMCTAICVVIANNVKQDENNVPAKRVEKPLVYIGDSFEYIIPGVIALTKVDKISKKDNYMVISVTVGKVYASEVEVNVNDKITLYANELDYYRFYKKPPKQCLVYLRRHKKRQSLVGYINRGDRAFFEDGKYFKPWLKKAEEIEKLQQARKVDPLLMLKKLTIHPEQEVSTWATKSFGKLIFQEIDHMERLLNSDKVSIKTRIKADYFFCRLKQDSWKKSDERLALLKKWFATELTEEDTSVCCKLFRESIKHFSKEQLFILAETLFENISLSADSLESATFTFSDISTSDAEKDKNISYIIDFLAKNNSLALDKKKAIIIALRGFTPLPKKSRLAIEKLLSEEKDQTLKEAFELVLTFDDW